MTRNRAALGALAAAVRSHELPNPRAASLGRVLAGTPRAATRFDDLAAAPDWLGLTPDEHLQLGRRAALAAIAPALAASIDGQWLGALAKAAGDEALDWARKQPCGGATIAAFAAQDIDEVAASALRDALPASLRGLAAPAARDFGVPAAALTAALA